jgi:hypothetical protein
MKRKEEGSEGREKMKKGRKEGRQEGSWVREQNGCKCYP